MKRIAWIFLFLFSCSVFIPTVIVACGQEMKLMMIWETAENPSSPEDSFPMDCPSSGENSESKDTQESSELSDYMKDFFYDSHLVPLLHSSGLLYFLSGNNSLSSSFFEILIPPPEA